MRQDAESPKSSELRREPLVTAFFEKRTCSVQYVVADSDTKQCALIDPVLDFEPKSGATSTHSADALLSFVKEQGYTPVWILDSHPHAAHRLILEMAAWIPRERLALESTLDRTKWFDYRFMSPMKATVLFATDYQNAFRVKHGTTFSTQEAPKKRGIPLAGILTSSQELNGHWRAR